MNVTIKVTNSFKHKAKPLLKKYNSLKKELYNLEEDLKSNPFQGSSLGSNLFKIRLSVESKGKGKSGGLRVITFLETEIISYYEKIENNITVYLIAIYDKIKQKIF